MNLTLQERIDWVINNPKIEKKSEMIINEIIKPLTEQAFEAGWKCKVNCGYKFNGTYHQDLDQWQKEYLK